MTNNLTDSPRTPENADSVPGKFILEIKGAQLAGELVTLDGCECALLDPQTVSPNQVLGWDSLKQLLAALKEKLSPSTDDAPATCGFVVKDQEDPTGAFVYGDSEATVVVHHGRLSVEQIRFRSLLNHTYGLAGKGYNGVDTDGITIHDPKAHREVIFFAFRPAVADLASRADPDTAALIDMISQAVEQAKPLSNARSFARAAGRFFSPQG